MEHKEQVVFYLHTKTVDPLDSLRPLRLMPPRIFSDFLCVPCGLTFLEFLALFAQNLNSK